MGRFRFLDIFSWLGLAAVLCWKMGFIVARRVGRIIKDWASGNWEDLKISSHDGGWKCDLCGTTGRGDASSFFALAEIEHFLEARCRGSLRPQDVLVELNAKTAVLRKDENGSTSSFIAGELTASFLALKGMQARMTEMMESAEESRANLMRKRIASGVLLEKEEAALSQEKPSHGRV